MATTLPEAINEAYSRYGDDWHAIFNDPAVDKALIGDERTSSYLRGLIFLGLLQLDRPSTTTMRPSQANGELPVTTPQDAAEIARLARIFLLGLVKPYQQIVNLRDSTDLDEARRAACGGALATLPAGYPTTKAQALALAQPFFDLNELVQKYHGYTDQASQKAAAERLYDLAERYPTIDIFLSPMENINKLQDDENLNAFEKARKALELVKYEVLAEGVPDLPRLWPPPRDALPLNQAWALPPWIPKEKFGFFTETAWDAREHRVWKLPVDRVVTYVIDPRTEQEYIDRATFMARDDAAAATPSLPEEEMVVDEPSEEHRNKRQKLTADERQTVAQLPRELMRIILEYASQQSVGQLPRKGAHSLFSKEGLAMWTMHTRDTQRAFWNKTLSTEGVRNQLLMADVGTSYIDFERMPSVFWVFIFDFLVALNARIRETNAVSTTITCYVVPAKEDDDGFDPPAPLKSLVSLYPSYGSNSWANLIDHRGVVLEKQRVTQLLRIARKSSGGDTRLDGHVICLAALIMSWTLPLRMGGTYVNLQTEIVDEKPRVTGEATYTLEAEYLGHDLKLQTELMSNLFALASIYIPSVAADSKLPASAVVDVIKRDHAKSSRRATPKLIESIASQYGPGLGNLELIVGSRVAGLVLTITRAIARKQFSLNLDPVVLRNETDQERVARTQQLAELVQWQRALLDSIEIHYTVAERSAEVSDSKNYLKRFRGYSYKPRHFKIFYEEDMDDDDYDYDAPLEELPRDTVLDLSRHTPLSVIVDPLTKQMLFTPTRYVIRPVNLERDRPEYRAFVFISIYKLQALLGAIPKTSAFDLYQALGQACDVLEETIARDV